MKFSQTLPNNLCHSLNIWIQLGFHFKVFKLKLIKIQLGRSSGISICICQIKKLKDRDLKCLTQKHITLYSMEKIYVWIQLHKVKISPLIIHWWWVNHLAVWLISLSCALLLLLSRFSPTPCDPIDGSPPGPTVPGILQARTLEWVAISSSNAWKWKWSHSVVSDS